jgi:hypothetical protein
MHILWYHPYLQYSDDTNAQQVVHLSVMWTNWNRQLLACGIVKTISRALASTNITQTQQNC